MNARKGNITVEPYTRSVRTVQREGRKSLNFSSTLFYGCRDSPGKSGCQAFFATGKKIPIPLLCRWDPVVAVPGVQLIGGTCCFIPVFLDPLHQRRIGFIQR